MKKSKTLPYFVLAGIIGSFRVVKESGVITLIPLWIGVVVISWIADKLIKWSDGTD